jgi:hypothetical protein
VELNSQVVFTFPPILIAAAMNGVYGIPLRLMKGWNWENTWAVWPAVGMTLLPLFAFSAPHGRVSCGNRGGVWGSARRAPF